jgi:hypothetical protein
MKERVRLLIIVLLGIFLFISGSIVSLQAAPFSVLFDEFGTGYYRDLGSTQDTWHVWNGKLQDDPTWPGHRSLIYIGPRTGVTVADYRDVVAYRNGAVSDIVRFYDPSFYDPLNDPTHTWVIFYSSDTSGGSLADTNGLPDPNSSPWHPIPGFDSVTEDSDGTFSWAWPNGGNEFTAFSEGHAAVPEPSTMLLLGSGLIGLWGLRKKFKK